MVARRLEVPTCHLVALWLEPADPGAGGTSLLMPLMPAPSGLSALVLQPADEVLSAVRERAQAAVAAAV